MTHLVDISDFTAVALGNALVSGRAVDIYALISLDQSLPDARRIEYEQQLFGRALTPEEHAEKSTIGRAERALMS